MDGFSGGCKCPLKDDPVCCDGNTHPTMCKASCLGYELSECTKGRCSDNSPCGCRKSSKTPPVCCGGNTFNSVCEAHCSLRSVSTCRPSSCDFHIFASSGSTSNLNDDFIPPELMRLMKDPRLSGFKDGLPLKLAKSMNGGREDDRAEKNKEGSKRKVKLESLEGGRGKDALPV